MLPPTEVRMTRLEDLCHFHHLLHQLYKEAADLFGKRRDGGRQRLTLALRMAGYVVTGSSHKSCKEAKKLDLS